MNKFKIALAGLAGIFAASSAFAGPNESATLNATIGAGALEIVPFASAFTPTSGSITATGSVQSDAVTFEINDVTVNDFNGDGSGFKLTVSANALTFGSSVMSVGSVSGFNNPSDAGNTTIVSATELDYTDGAGVAGYTVDFDIAYDVPAFAESGTYSGTVDFTVAAL